MNTSITIVAIVGSAPCEYVVAPWSYALQTWPDATEVMAITPATETTNVSARMMLGYFFCLSHCAVGACLVGFKQLRAVHPSPATGGQTEAVKGNACKNEHSEPQQARRSFSRRPHTSHTERTSRGATLLSRCQARHTLFATKLLSTHIGVQA
jgi:hypothetical protein